MSFQGTPLKVVVIGLDGGTFDLVKPWVDAGFLPTFQRLMNSGVWGELRSTMPPITAPAWSSFITGKNPGNHGLIDFVKRRPGTYKVSPVNASVRKGHSLWSLLSAANKEVLVVNVPVTYPPEAVNGVLISGLLTPSDSSDFTYPSELASKLRASGYRIHSPQSYARGNIDRFLKSIEETTAVQINHLWQLMDEGSWDFMMYVFRGPDRMQHGLWHFMDPEHPQHGAPGTERYKNAILEHYQSIDGYLADLLDRLDHDTVLILMSDHGFGPFHKYIYMNNWLMKWGLMQLKRGPASIMKNWVFKAGITPISIYNQMLKLGLGGMKGRVTKGKGQKKLARFFLSFDDLDWSRTSVYSLGNAGQLWINVLGREPQGIVSPGAHYEAVRNEVIDLLLAMRDPQTDEKMVDQVYTREELYSGAYVNNMPDIVFVPKGFRYLSFGEYEFASNRLVDVSYGITGWHRLNGMALFHGRPIQPGSQLIEARIEDIAPTILYLQNQPVPSSMDGRVLAEILKRGWVDPKRITSREEVGDKVQQEIDLSAEDEAAVRQRLEDLGYLG